MYITVYLYIYNVMILYSKPKKDRKVNPIHTKRVTRNLGLFRRNHWNSPFGTNPNRAAHCCMMFPPSLSS